VKSLVGDKVQGSNDLADLVKKFTKPRGVWVMLPAGKITANTGNQLGTLLECGDTIIDGGNAFFQDDVRRAKAMKQKGIHYVDCGTSSGVWGGGARLLPDDRRREGGR
jgi:6-phosphogluconate dehydrogenase